jgi:hypothetical protein
MVQMSSVLQVVLVASFILRMAFVILRANISFGTTIVYAERNDDQRLSREGELRGTEASHGKSTYDFWQAKYNLLTQSKPALCLRTNRAAVSRSVRNVGRRVLIFYRLKNLL